MVNPYIRPSQNSKPERQRFTNQTGTYYTTIILNQSTLILPTKLAFIVEVAS